MIDIPVPREWLLVTLQRWQNGSHSVLQKGRMYVLDDPTVTLADRLVSIPDAIDGRIIISEIVFRFENENDAAIFKLKYL